LLSVTHGKALARQLIFASIADGQLFWSAIALSAAAIYEVTAALEQQKGRTPFLELAIAAFGLIAFTCSILVMSATLKAYSDRSAAKDAGSKWMAGIPQASGASTHSSFSATVFNATVKVSIWLTGMAAPLFAALHTYRR
jgi:hypothetical protein